MTEPQHKNSPKNVAPPENIDFLIAEYTALREEIVKRIEIGYQLVALTLTASGIVLTIGLQTKNAFILLIYPILILFLSAFWMNNETDIVNIGNYIREHIEPQTTENTIGWEHNRPQTLRVFQVVTIVGARATFISAALLAILIGLSVTTFNAIEKVLLILDVLSILLSAVLFVLTTIQNRGKLFRLAPRDSRKKANSFPDTAVPNGSTHLQ